MKPLIAGLVFVGGILVLLMASDDEDEKKEEENPKQKNLFPDSETKINVEEIRRLRRELRHQMALKKKSTTNKPPSK